jgi:hypothetical protein
MKGLSVISTALVAIMVSAASARPETIADMMTSAMKRNGEDLNVPSFLNADKAGKQGKSKFLALGLSLLLPGAGQYYVGSKSKMIIFGSSEAAVWTGFFGLRLYGGWKKEDYKAWAAFHAGVDVNGKPDIYYEKMTYYDNLNEYNQLARVMDGSEAILFPNTPRYYWNWDSNQSRSHFRNLRNQSKNAYRRSLLFVGAALVNRVLAGIDAYRSAAAFTREQEFSRAGWNLYYSSVGSIRDGEIEIGITIRF